jgi:hypothetical protein
MQMPVLCFWTLSIIHFLSKTPSCFWILSQSSGKSYSVWQFLHHLNIIRPSIRFTLEVEANYTLPFLDVLVMNRGPKLAAKMLRKPPTHTDRYPRFKFNHTHHLEIGVIDSLISRVKAICQDQKDFNNEIKNIRHEFLMNTEKNLLTI